MMQNKGILKTIGITGGIGAGKSQVLDYIEKKYNCIVLKADLIANQMKKCFLTWNKEVVDDKKIFDDLRELSKGKLDISEDFLKLVESRDVLHTRKNKSNQIKWK